MLTSTACPRHTASQFTEARLVSCCCMDMNSSTSQVQLFCLKIRFTNKFYGNKKDEIFLLSEITVFFCACNHQMQFVKGNIWSQLCFIGEENHLMWTKVVSLKLPPVKVLLLQIAAIATIEQHERRRMWLVWIDLPRSLRFRLEGQVTSVSVRGVSRLESRNDWWVPAPVRWMSGQMVVVPLHYDTRSCAGSWKGHGNCDETILFVHARLWLVAHPFVELNVLHVVVLFLLSAKTNGISLSRKITQNN